MQGFVNDAMVPYHAVVNSLQLVSVDLPDAYEASIEATTIVEQYITTVGNIQQQSQIEADTIVYNARLEADLIGYQAEQEAEATARNYAAAADAINLKLGAEAEAYKSLLDRLSAEFGESGSSQVLLDQIWIEMARTSSTGQGEVIVEVSAGGIGGE